MDTNNQTIIFERNNLIFIFNFHTSNSIPDYEFTVPKEGEYKILLNSDDAEFGGHGRIAADQTFHTMKDEYKNNRLKIYNTNRTTLVLKKV